ncbi:MAG: ZIP family metal transporter [Candidatus Aenigmarchaeota archaeon]|nr:ZIP family metal transporter [Candidatus Aenigmarchaeota archaeon]
MAELFEILVFVIVSSLIGLTGGLLLLRSSKLAHRLSFGIVAFAIGALLASAFLDFLPEALETGDTEVVFVGVLAGMLVFFFIEKFLIWHHHHTYGEKEHHHPFNALVLIGDSIHNFIDGVIIAAAFVVSPQIGVPAFIAIIMHEIPQEISDFGLLIRGGMKKSRVVLFNVTSAMFSVVGAVIAYFFLTQVEGLVSPMLAFAAGAFIYIAASDLIPETKRTVVMSRSALQIALVIVGIAVIWYTGHVAHGFFEA